jgi:hypothetical protein
LPTLTLGKGTCVFPSAQLPNTDRTQTEHRPNTDHSLTAQRAEAPSISVLPYDGREEPPTKALEYADWLHEWWISAHDKSPPICAVRAAHADGGDYPPTISARRQGGWAWW